jgi:transcriptional regulator with XRE-family HTH domain
MAMNNEFGELLKEFRLALGVGQSEFSKMIGMKPSNLNAVEHGRRKPPESPDKLREMAIALGLEEGSENWMRFVDAAARVADELPVDVRHMTQRRLLPVLLRTIDDRQMSDEELAKLIAALEGGREDVV